MARARARIEIDQVALAALCRQTALETAKAGATAAVRYVKEEITATGRVDTGRMRDTVDKHLQKADEKRATFWVKSEPRYAIFQNWGTGPIVPVRAQALRFVSGGKVIFAKRTRGVPAARFYHRARRRLRPSDFVTR